jgi:hypothetical protein
MQSDLSREEFDEMKASQKYKVHGAGLFVASLRIAVGCLITDLVTRSARINRL